MQDCCASPLQPRLPTGEVNHAVQHVDVVAQHGEGPLEYVGHADNRRQVEDVGVVVGEPEERRWVTQVSGPQGDARACREALDCFVPRAPREVVDDVDLISAVEQMDREVVPQETGARPNTRSKVRATAIANGM